MKLEPLEVIDVLQTNVLATWRPGGAKPVGAADIRGHPSVALFQPLKTVREPLGVDDDAATVRTSACERVRVGDITIAFGNGLVFVVLHAIDTVAVVVDARARSA